MKKTVKIFVFAAFILVAGIIFTACGGKSNDKSTEGTNKPDPNGEESAAMAEDLTPYLPVIDFGGYEFTILCVNDTVVVEMDQEKAEVVNDARYYRNRLIEEKYNIILKTVADIPDVHNDDIYNKIRQANAAGDYIYDIAFPNMLSAGKLALDNQLVNIKDIPHMDLTKPWWTPSAVAQLSLASKLYFTPADIHTGSIERLNVTLFSKTLVERHELENLYETVNSGKWTFDKLYDMCKAVTLDLDGDGKIQGFNDQYGITTFLGHGVYWGWLTGANEVIVGKDGDDYPEIKMGTQRFYDVYEKIRAFTHDYGFVANANSAWMQIGDRNDVGFAQIFTSDKALFLMEVMECAERFREMQTNFGIIPFPKYNESQERYHTYSAWSTALFLVPASNTELERTGIISEALAAESSRTVMPAYIDVALGSKYLRDEESRPMVDLILNTRMYDLAYIYNWGDIGNLVNQALIGNKKDIVSIYEKNEAKVKSAIEKSIEKINDLD